YGKEECIERDSGVWRFSQYLLQRQANPRSAGALILANAALILSYGGFNGIQHLVHLPCLGRRLLEALAIDALGHADFFRSVRRGGGSLTELVVLSDLLLRALCGYALARLLGAHFGFLLADERAALFAFGFHGLRVSTTCLAGCLL